MRGFIVALTSGLLAIATASPAFAECNGIVVGPGGSTGPMCPNSADKQACENLFGCTWRPDPPPVVNFVSLNVCNHSAINGANVAIGFFSNNAWQSRGYYVLNRGQCALVVAENDFVTNTNVYVYASTDVRGTDFGQHWPGVFAADAATFCVSNGPGFGLPLNGACAPNQHPQRFMKIPGVPNGPYEFDLN